MSEDKQMTYFEKLRLPQWQEKRLRIMDRDDFCCQNCFTREKNIQVHHRKYKWNADPWDYEDEFLVSLCEDCHKVEMDSFRESFNILSDVIKKTLFSEGVKTLTKCLNVERGEWPYDTDVCLLAVEELMSDKKKFGKFVDEFVARESKKRRRAKNG